jgi:hypothetical protein
MAYDGATKIATLATPISISLGYNESVGDVTAHYSMIGNVTDVSSAVTKGQGLPKLSTDESGNFVGIFNVPANMFQTGQRIFRVDNRTVAADPLTATSYAEGTFTASGLSTTSQKLEFGPSIDSAATAFTQVRERQKQLISTVTTYSPYDPVAQTFIIEKDNYPGGVYISSVKLFFYSKPTTNIPVKISIIGTLNGYPNGVKLDHSSVV